MQKNSDELTRVVHLDEPPKFGGRGWVSVIGYDGGPCSVIIVDGVAAPIPGHPHTTEDEARECLRLRLDRFPPELLRRLEGMTKQEALHTSALPNWDEEKEAQLLDMLAHLLEPSVVQAIERASRETNARWGSLVSLALTSSDWEDWTQIINSVDRAQAVDEANDILGVE